MLWIVFLISLGSAFLVTRLSIALSHRRGVLDIPNARSSHSQPVPRLGGVGIIAATLISFAALETARTLGWNGNPVFRRDTGVILLTGLGMAAIGLYDDFRGLRPSLKFLIQLLIAGLIVGAGIKIESVSFLNLGPIPIGFLAIPLTMLWLTGFTNVFNFMDGINGISGVTAATYFAFFAVLAWEQGHAELVATAVIFMGSCLGFIPNNFPAARTFMGDTGSLLLGITLAYFVARLAQLSSDPAAGVALLLICSVYLWDSTFTLLRRLRRGENIFQAHRTHLYQRLVQRGQSHARITVLYFALHVLMGCLALAFLKCGMAWRAAILGCAALTLTAFTSFVYLLERRAARAATASN